MANTDAGVPDDVDAPDEDEDEELELDDVVDELDVVVVVVLVLEELALEEDCTPSVVNITVRLARRAFAAVIFIVIPSEVYRKLTAKIVCKLSVQYVEPNIYLI